MAEKMIDPWFKQPVAQPRSLTTKNPDHYEKEHAVPYSGAESLGNMAVRLNRALRDKRTARPGPGRWVEYILPDLRRVYVESNLRKVMLGRLNDDVITARVVIKPGGLEYTNNLSSLVFMRMVEVSGDMLDVVRTADKVGLYVQDPETRGKTNFDPSVDKLSSFEEIPVSLVKEAAEKGKKKPGYFAKMRAATEAKRPENRTGVKGKLLNDPAYYKPAMKRTLKGGAKGSAVGAAIGAGAGALAHKKLGLPRRHAAAAGAALGGVTGLDVGMGVAGRKHDKEYLASKGITLGRLGQVKHMTPQAKKKYLHHKYEGGGRTTGRF